MSRPMAVMRGWMAVSSHVFCGAHTMLTQECTQTSLSSWQIREKRRLSTPEFIPRANLRSRDDVLNIGFVPEEEKDDVAVFMDAVTCKPAPGDSYRIPSHRWNLSDGAGADVYTVSDKTWP